MRDRGIKVYSDNKKATSIFYERPLNFKFSFDYGPRVDTVGSKGSGEATIKFKEGNTGSYVYSGETSHGHFTTLYRRWYTPWILEGFSGDDKIFEFNFDESLRGGKIGISVDSSSLGDTLAWIPVIHKLKEKYDCDIYVTTFWNELLALFYNDIRFCPPGYREPKTNALFGIGWYEEDNRNIHKRDPRSISLQQVAGDHIGIDLEEDVLFPEVPDIIKRTSPTIEGKYVCIAIDSTANAKHWHYPNGWQEIVNYLNEIGYKVVAIQKQSVNLNGIIDKTGDLSIIERAIDIYHSDFVIGIGSGLSWLGWALHKPVVMISGFSLPKCEFSTKNYRIINTSVCHGCFNDTSHKFDRGDWNWCPRLKETPDRFICTTSIKPETVKEAIRDLIEKEGLE